jgi:dethiobiotin synthetase
MPGKGVFITGTDTGVGKTAYACALLQALRRKGHTVAAMKPVASGAGWRDGSLRNPDALALQQAAGGDQSYAQINRYCFAPAIAPHLAAAGAGVQIELPPLRVAYEQLRQQAEIIVVEGVGGWLVPLNDRETVADLAQVLQLPIVLVVGMRLGCLNHALLTAQAIEATGLRLAGWVANTIEPEMPALTENLATLGARLSAPLLDVIPYVHTSGDHEVMMSSLPLRTDWLED